MTRPHRRRRSTRPAAEPLEPRALFAGGGLRLADAATSAAGPTPTALATVDLNGDGLVDVVAANYGAATVSVLLNVGGGAFAPPVSYAVGQSPQSLAVGDFDGDGHTDVAAVGNGTDAVAVLLGAGDGTLGPATFFAVGRRPEAVVAVDLNGDGRPDLVTADQGADTLSVLTNAGGGAFAAAVPVDAGVGPTALAAGDLNGDGHPDLVALTPTEQQVRVLLNNGDGTFPADPPAYPIATTGRSIVIADVTNDARPDVVVTNTRPPAVSVLANLGRGQLAAPDAHRTTAFPFGLAVADLTGDNRPDFVTAGERANDVGVLVRRAGTVELAERSFRVGTAPGDVAVADVNADGRPDVIAADFNDDAISVLLNQTAFPALTATTATLSASQNPQQLGNAVTLTATVTPSPIAGGGGTVQFLAGARVLGRGTLTPVTTTDPVTGVTTITSSVATLTTTQLPLGTVALTARYNGNGRFAPSAAAADETVLSADASAPLVAATAVSVVGGPFLPGDTETATVTITDTGPGTARGTVGVTLTAVPMDGSAAVPLAVVRGGTVNVNLRGGRSQTAVVRFALPAGLAAGSYTITAALTPTGTLPAAAVTTTAATTAAPITVVLAFGTIGARRLPPLTATLSNGAVVTLSLTGPGTGNVVDQGNGAIAVTLTNTRPGSTVRIVPQSGTVTLARLDDLSPLGGVDAPLVPLVGSVFLSVGVRRVALGGVTDSTVILGPTYPTDLTLGPVVNTVLTTSGRIRSIAVDSWTGGTLAVVGAVDRLTVAGSFSAVAAAASSFGTVAVGGDLNNATVLAGASIGRGQLGIGFDTFNVGRITAVQVGGNVVGSLVAAGLQPVSDDPFTAAGATLLRGGRIGRITVGGTVDAASQFLAASVPAVG